MTGNALRAYQLEAHREVVRRLGARRPRGGAPRLLVTMPTGSGKTVTYAHLAAEFPGRVLVGAHRRELVRQGAEKLAARGVRAGIIAPGFPADPGARVQIGSVQTLAGRDIGKFDLIIPDEAHHAVTPQWRKLLAGDGAVVGFTATAERLDGTGLGDVFDSIVPGPTIPPLTAAGFLAPVRVFAPEAVADMRGRPESAAGDVMDRPHITGDAIEHYEWHAPTQPAIAFCASVEHAHHVAAAFAARGWRAVAVSGRTHPIDRDRAIAGLATGEVEILCACDLISEGLDVPSVGAVILLRPTQSLSMFLQMVGRGMRPAPGKSFLSVLDHAGNALRHGMPDAAREWTLDGAKRRPGDSVPALRQCSHCFAIHSPAAACPVCGTTSSTANTAGPRRVRLADGTLTELSAEDVRLIATPLRDLLREARTHADVARIAEVRGYMAAWVDRMMRFKNPGAGRRRHTAAEDFV